MFDTPEYLSSFHPSELTHYHRKLSTTAQLVKDRVQSKSFITALSDEKQKEVLEGVEEIVKRGEGKRWIDESKGTFGESVLSCQEWVLKRV
jgi:hypothetical protein